jgi:DNA-binding transcriptional regulator YiaG
VTPEQIKALRLKMGMTQRQFAACIGAQRNSVWRWEAGIHPASPLLDKLLRLLADEQGIKIED